MFEMQPARHPAYTPPVHFVPERVPIQRWCDRAALGNAANGRGLLSRWTLMGKLAGAMFAIAMAAWPGDARAAWTMAEESRLLRGEVVARIVSERGPGGRLLAAIDIPAPSSAVWRVMLDCARAPAYVPGLESCTILEAAADGRSDIRETKVRWIALFPSLTLRFRSDYILEREIRVERVGGDLAAMRGTWTLEPREGGSVTRLHYDFRIVPRTPLPSSLVRAGLMRDAPRVLRAVRAEVARTTAP